jgi:predicted GNAT superfamily acetyltransferase
MSDVRPVICGLLAAIAIIGAIVLAAFERDATTVASLLGLAGTLAGYVVGLYSEPIDHE